MALSEAEEQKIFEALTEHGKKLSANQVTMTGNGDPVGGVLGRLGKLEAHMDKIETILPTLWTKKDQEELLKAQEEAKDKGRSGKWRKTDRRLAILTIVVAIVAIATPIIVVVLMA